MIQNRQEINSIAKQLGMDHNVSIRVIDQQTGKCVQEHIGHNAATNSMLTGIAHYLVGNTTSSQGSYTLSSGNYTFSDYLPKYISLGTMGLYNQGSDFDGLPSGIGVDPSLSEQENFWNYMNHCPGYGADGYDEHENNNRAYFGLGPMFPNRPNQNMTIDCELISDTFPRSQITFRDIIPEYKSELQGTIDVVFSAMISTGGLRQFREEGKDYIFITEVGLWSRKAWDDSGDNGLLAAYRIIPPNKDNWDMDSEANRDILKHNIIRVGINQVVQIIWKVQLGALSDFGGLTGYRPILWTVT